MADDAPRALPPELDSLRDLALDLRWTWSHAADHLWRMLDPDAWERLENPWTLLHDVGDERLAALSHSPEALGELARLTAARRAYLADGSWFSRARADRVRGIAYFSMEFGLGEALPLYAGGLGVLAGDVLKGASDLGVPLIGIGLLYQQGFFRQVIDRDGRQREVYPFNEPTSLPVEPVRTRTGAWLHIPLEFPGRLVFLRVWQARVGRTRLYLLDSNDPLNSAVDRGITARLYGTDREERFLQEVVLGVGGWRVVEALGLDIEICHLNEGHPAFAILERARCYMVKNGVPFEVALWATRAGNVFTTHTAMESAFDAYDYDFVDRHRAMLEPYVARLGLTFEQLMALGRRHPGDIREPFTLSYLALRACIATNAVSALHTEVSRRLFADLFPRWPLAEVPVQQVTNGVHVPTWDSQSFDAVWEKWCGKGRWLGTVEELPERIKQIPDEDLWTARNASRTALVEFVRTRMARQLAARGSDSATIAMATRMFDPSVLTIGFARRFTPYKRPGLPLTDPARLKRILLNRERPVQLVIAGKAHPDDVMGKEIIAQWVRFAREPDVRPHVVFLEDYDLTLAETLVRGVDVWLNMPRRPWEACGTSGMKVVSSGGLNCSELDGWWAEAFTPEVGWAIDHADVAGGEAGQDTRDADRLYRLLEEEIVPLFYTRDGTGMPRKWLERVRMSMAELTPRFSANRMLMQYVDDLYVPAAARLRGRHANGARDARSLAEWERSLRLEWDSVGVGATELRRDEERLCASVAVHLGSMDPESIVVELYADAVGGEPAMHVPLTRAERLPGGPGVVLYRGSVETSRPVSDFTARAMPRREGVRVPTELPLIRWGVNGSHPLG